MTTRQPLFCDARLAERIERAGTGRMAAASERASAAPSRLAS